MIIIIAVITMYISIRYASIRDCGDLRQLMFVMIKVGI
jgi:hypothetical protein